MAYLKASDYLPLHSKLVRDVKFSPDAPGVLLSVGEDKFMKLTNMYSNSSMHRYSTVNSTLLLCQII